MSAFEIAHLKQCYKRADTRARRLQIIVDAFLYHGVTARSRDFITFMGDVPDILIPTHPTYGDVQKYWKQFDIFHTEWMKLDNEETFAEYLHRQNQRHDIDN